MSSTGGAPDIVFRGTDGTEAEEFIVAIERLAFTEGWSEDPKRMLLFARTCLRYKALRWFSKLDPSKKNDWDLFVEALLDQYPLIEAPTEAEMSTPVWSATTFSPGASTAILSSDQGLNPQDERHVTGANPRHSVLPNCKAYDPSILGRQLGILRIVVEDGTASPQYVWRGPHPFDGRSYGENLKTTINRQEALVVCFIPSSEIHPIACLNAVYNLPDLFLSYSSTNPLECTLRVARGLVEFEIPKKGQLPGAVSVVWNVASDGSLEASLSVNDPSNHLKRQEAFKTSEVHINTLGTWVRFVKPGSPVWQEDPNRNTQVSRHYDFRARIVFEPL